MARHRRHRRRHYRDAVISMPSFGSLRNLNPIAGHVAAKDVAIGAVIGIGGGALVNYALNQVWPTRPAFLTQYAAPINAGIAGVAAGMLFAKKNPQKGRAFVLGALTAGLTGTVASLLASAGVPGFSGLIRQAPIGPRFAGMIGPAPIRSVPSMSPVRRAIRA